MRWYRLLVALVVLANVGLVWVLPVLPGQDLPQHLAYVRILLDHHDPQLPFGEMYQLPTVAQPYFSTYYLLCALARLSSVDVGIRLLYSVYIVLMMIAFTGLVRAVHPGHSGARWTPILGALTLWTPVAVMGFLAFMVGVPLILLACGLFLRAASPRGTALHDLSLFGLGAVLVSLHVVAAACLALFLIIHVCVAFRKRTGLIALASISIMASVHVLWGHLASDGLATSRVSGWTANPWHFLQLLEPTWSEWSLTASYPGWTVLGPFRSTGQAFVAAALAPVFWYAWKGRAQTTPEGRWTFRVAVVFLLVGSLAPWGLDVPTEVSFLNLRLMTVGFPLLLAAVPPGAFSGGRSRLALALIGLSITGQFGYRAIRFGQEAGAVLSLLGDASPTGRLLPLVFFHESQHFGWQFRLTHFLPMYHTVRNGGVTAQFWARYTDHLPVGYRPGKRPQAPPDWAPAEFEAKHLPGFDFVLVEAPAPDDRPETVAAFERTRRILDARTDRVRCDGRWCLYCVRRATGSLGGRPASALASAAR